MTEKEINKMYIDRFIDSMETDYQNWKITHCAGAGWSWTEYYSPDYKNENGRVSFGFSLNYNGAWVDGHFNWRKPFLNPFSKTFWRFRNAKRKMIEYLQNKEEQEYLQKLNDIIA